MGTSRQQPILRVAMVQPSFFRSATTEIRMLIYPQFLLIGGATRNVGKTSFTVQTIQHFAQQIPIVGLKIKTLRGAEDPFHGKDSHPLATGYLLREESYPNPEDTGRMMEAGAQRAFHIKCYEHALAQAIEAFVRQVGQAWVVCESNSVRRVLVPGVFLLIKHRDQPNNIKPSAAELEHLADHIVWTDGYQHSFAPSQLSIQSATWQVNQSI